jgi:hypothetical protein
LELRGKEKETETIQEGREGRGKEEEKKEEKREKDIKERWR